MLRNIAFAFVLVLLLLLGFWVYSQTRPLPKVIINTPTETGSDATNSASPSAQAIDSSKVDAEMSEVMTTNLNVPWAIVFLPDGQMLVTERPGRVRLVNTTGKAQTQAVLTVPGIKAIGEGGLLGIVLHPNFAQNKYVYLYYTYGGAGNNTLNRVARYTYNDNKLSDPLVIVDQIPGGSNHDGGRIKFGPDNFLYIGTGDAEEPSQAQDTNTLGGKILRVTDEGKMAPGNPFNNLVYSYGHRNVQGLAWDDKGNLWATEHGRSTPTGFDELNLIKAGKNYGWPTIQGDETKEGMETPKRNSGATNTWAPSGLAFYQGALYFSGLRGQAVYKATIDGESVKDFSEKLKSQFGRIREVILGPNNLLYITTSNRDGRGSPTSTDDRIIRLNPSKL